ncbi:MAG: SprT family zinc-dependent metalloprotease [Sulfuricurvum sp.]|nr:SprT family zinc-dependent metalloprotease [Sulfuricurvum sp.]
MFDPHTSAITIYYRPRNKNTYISVSKNKEVSIRTPIKDEYKIRKIIEERTHWIRNKLESINLSPIQSYTFGETIRFRGELLTVEQLPQLHKMVMKSKNSKDMEKYYYKFYKDEAEITLPSRIHYYSKKMGLSPTEIRYKKMRRRWGSCTNTGIVTFNTLMLQLSYEHIDYIIVHELAHLKYMNHSKDFHAFVRIILGNEKELRQQLKQLHIS